MAETPQTKGFYSQRPAEQYVPAENVPDLIDVPEKTIRVLTESDRYLDSPLKLIEPLAGKREREWFTQHFYFCLPMTFGCQHGFVIKLLYDVLLRWNGGPNPGDLAIHLGGSDAETAEQKIASHFGTGIMTVQNRWMYRTPKGVNMMVIPPPNYPIDGISHIMAVVETDQLRRDFTFNLKVTVKNKDILIPKGTPIGCILPYPRGFLDGYKLEYQPAGKALDNERETMRHFGVARSEYDEGKPGLIYMRGEDIYGNKFAEHQKTLPSSATEEWSAKHMAFVEKLFGAVPPVPMQIHRNSTAAGRDELSEAWEGKKALAFSRVQKDYPSLGRDMFDNLVNYIQSNRLAGHSDETIVNLLVETGWARAAATGIVNDLG